MLKQALVRALAEFGDEVDERGDSIVFARVVAERKAFLSRKRLVYRANVRVDEAKREIRLAESLTETGVGLAAEGGVGFRTETYRTRRGPRDGGIAEQSKLFGKVYAYTFDHGAIRTAIETLARQHGYAVHHDVVGG